MSRGQGPEPMWSECGQPILNKSQAINHAAECCSVGRLGPEVCSCCGQIVHEGGVS